MRHVANAAAAARRGQECRTLLYSRSLSFGGSAPQTPKQHAKQDRPTLRPFAWCREATCSQQAGAAELWEPPRCARRKGQRGAGQSSGPRAAREGVEGVSTCMGEQFAISTCMGEQFAKQLMERHENDKKDVTNTKTRKLQLQQAPAQTQQNRVNTTVMDDPGGKEA